MEMITQSMIVAEVFQ